MGLWQQLILTAGMLAVFSTTAAQGQVTISIDTLTAGKSTTILFEAQINSPLPARSTQGNPSITFRYLLPLTAERGE